MPRQKNLSLDYFPFDTSFFFEDSKAKALRRAHGTVGLLTQIWLTSNIFRGGYFFTFDSFDELCMDIAESIGNTGVLDIVPAVAGSIRYLADTGVIDPDLLSKNVVSGEEFQKRYILIAKKSRRIIRMEEHCVVDIDSVLAEIEKNEICADYTPICTETPPICTETPPICAEKVENVTFGTQSKSKSKSKSKSESESESKSESKNENNNNTTNLSHSSAQARACVGADVGADVCKGADAQADKGKSASDGASESADAPTDKGKSASDGASEGADTDLYSAYRPESTAELIARLRAEEAAEYGDRAPPIDAVTVARYLREITDLDLIEALIEAERFCNYNQGRGWDCMPNWKAAARLWVERM